MKRTLAVKILLAPLLAIVGCSAVQHEQTPADAGAAVGDTARLLVVHEDGGKAWNIFGLKIVGKVMSEATGGQYSVIVSTTPPGGGPPRHVHRNEDEMFYVLEGEFEFYSGGETTRAQQGALVILPRGIPHGFRNVGPTAGMLMNTMTPGGFEGFFEEIDRLPKDGPLDRQLVETIASRYGLSFLPEPAEGSGQER